MTPLHLLPVLSLLPIVVFATALGRQTFSYAALGDSYASGDGAGASKLFPNFDITCGRFSEAYPVQVANSTDIDIPSHDFKNLACGGASSLNTLYSQVPRIGDSDVVSITVGGNEVDFFVVLNACVYQWWPLGTCEKEMATARTLVQSTSFINNFNKMVARTKRKVDDNDGVLLVTGYAAFFNDQTEQCNKISFSKRDPTNVLTKELRRDFNEMVRLINDVIKASAEAHGAMYVDVDRLFEGHRFCEQNVTEPSDREDTWFFNMNFNKSDTERSGERGGDVQRILPGPIKDFFDLTKTFHPTGFGHSAIASEIIRLLNMG